MSLHPEYNNKIDHAHLMALVGKLKNTGSRFYKKLSEYYYFLKEACEAAGFHKITRNSLQLLTFAELLCKKNANAEESEMCDKFNWLIGFQSVRKVRFFRIFHKMTLLNSKILTTAHFRIIF